MSLCFAIFCIPFLCYSFLFVNPVAGISGGTPAKGYPGYQSVVRIQRVSGTDQEYFHGVLVHPQVIVSQYYVLHSPPIPFDYVYQIVLGGDTELFGEEIQIRHHFFGLPFRHEMLGLVIVNTPFRMSSNFFPALMAFEKSVEKIFVAMSWGGPDNEKRQEFHNELQALKLTPIEMKKCDDVYYAPEKNVNHWCMQVLEGKSQVYNDIGAPVFELSSGVCVGIINYDNKPKGNPGDVNVVLVAQWTSELTQFMRSAIQQGTLNRQVLHEDLVAANADE